MPKDVHGKPIANSVARHKRPRSSITPTIVLTPDGKLEMLTGSPGGAPIICYVAKNLIWTLDFKQDIMSAIASPNLCAMNSSLVLEDGSDLLTQKTALENLGESITVAPLVSGETSIRRANSGGWYGAADPRREGVAIGE